MLIFRVYGCPSPTRFPVGPWQGTDLFDVNYFNLGTAEAGENVVSNGRVQHSAAVISKRRVKNGFSLWYAGKLVKGGA